ncbi:MAG: oxidoreductase domain protein, partial [Paenibacillus sp.]|nr:oxidoreductase domain protein [Paenibacillus sp.]
SLTAYNPMEGWKATFIGSKGRLEAADCHRGAGSENPNQYIQVYNMNGEKITTAIGKAQGGHGGGDHRLRRMIFVGDVKDTLGQQAGSREGAMSMMIGAAANLSIAHGRAFSIPELLRQPSEALPAVGNG